MNDGREPERDARLQAALRHAPDADQAAPPLLRARILAAAHRSAEGAAPRHGSGGARWLRELLGGPWRLGGAAGTAAAALLAATVLWVGRDEQPEAPDLRPAPSDMRAREAAPPRGEARGAGDVAADRAAAARASSAALGDSDARASGERALEGDAAPRAGAAAPPPPRAATLPQPAAAPPPPAPAPPAPPPPAPPPPAARAAPASPTPQATAPGHLPEPLSAPAPAPAPDPGRAPGPERAPAQAPRAAPSAQPAPADAPAGGARELGEATAAQQARQARETSDLRTRAERARSAPADANRAAHTTAPAITSADAAGAPEAAGTRAASPAAAARADARGPRSAEVAPPAPFPAESPLARADPRVPTPSITALAGPQLALLVDQWAPRAASEDWRIGPANAPPSAPAARWLRELAAAARGRWQRLPGGLEAARDAGEEWWLTQAGARRGRVAWTASAVIVCDERLGRCERAELAEESLRALRQSTSLR